MVKGSVEQREQALGFGCLADEQEETRQRGVGQYQHGDHEVKSGVNLMLPTMDRKTAYCPGPCVLIWT